MCNYILSTHALLVGVKIALLPTGHVQGLNLEIIALLPMGLNEPVPLSHMIIL